MVFYHLRFILGHRDRIPVWHFFFFLIIDLRFEFGNFWIEISVM